MIAKPMIHLSMRGVYGAGFLTINMAALFSAKPRGNRFANTVPTRGVGGRWLT
jgi:hypothetical protein